jgi:FtsH-binding integral membrane protein
MIRVYRILVEFCWAAGLLCLLVAVVFRFVPSVAEGVAISPRGALIFAGALFLCTLATREMEDRTK